VRYLPYGGIRVQVGEMPTALGFTGQRLDAGVGLLYYRARYYDPGLGRFTQPDTLVPSPADPQSLNRYAYVHNNPLRFTDPTGHCVPGVNCPIPDATGGRSVWYVSPVRGVPYRSGYGYGGWSRFTQNVHWAEDIRNLNGSRDNPTSYGGQGREVFAIEDGRITAISRGGGTPPTGNNPDDYVIWISFVGGVDVEYRHTMPLLIDPQGPADDPGNWAIRPGDPVYRGQQIGFYAQVGVSTGPHIHFAASRDGRSVDPGSLFGIDADGDGVADTVPQGNWGTTPTKPYTSIVQLRQSYSYASGGNDSHQIW